MTESSEGLPRSFFNRPSLEVARDLLGRDLVHRDVVVRLTEVEAYAGPDDPASHAYRGVTPRNAVMFGPPGFLYVYFSYGVHWCANVVCGPDGFASAVLLRAGVVVGGLEVARSRRVTARNDAELARGPGRLTSALGLGREHDGADLCREGATVRLTAGRSRRPTPLCRSGPRVGLTKAVDTPWRLWVDRRRDREPVPARRSTYGRITPVSDILDDLEWRGLLQESTDRDELRAALDAGPVTFYVGFDPTAPSLHFGHLVQVLTARRLQLAGHRPLALVGGATGLIGDPRESGERTHERPGGRRHLGRAAPGADRAVPRLHRRPRRDHGQQPGLDGAAAAPSSSCATSASTSASTGCWTARPCPSAWRPTGISFTEFSYVLLQSNDYLQLHRRYGCTLQLGGSDQWGNITAGCELIRRTDGRAGPCPRHPAASPRRTAPSSARRRAASVWLDPAMTSPYAFYQYWLNVEDASLGSLLRIFTFRSHEEIEALERGGRGAARRPRGPARAGR